MSKINTNVSSLIAQNILSRSNGQLQTALNRLSTGLRINNGKDDPAGLIASENLRRDIISINKAIGNSERANQLIATADGALGQVSNLLNDIRGLVTEAANEGALSDEQIAANQLQVDSSLEAIDRIAQVTTFQGRRLLDGSLGFITNGGTNFAEVTNLSIEQANLGANDNVSISVDVTAAATQAQVDVTDIAATTTGVNSAGTLTFTDTLTAATATFTFAGPETINLTAKDGGAFEGTLGNTDITIDIQQNGGAAASASRIGNTITVLADISGISSGPVTAADIAAAIDSDLSADFDATGSVGFIAAPESETETLSGGVDAGVDVIDITSVSQDPSNDRLLVFDSSGDTGGAITVLDDGATITVTVDDNTDVDLSAVVDAINTTLAGTFSASLSGTGNSSFNAIVTGDDAAAEVDLTGGVNPGGLQADVVFQLSGAAGSDVFSFETGTSLSQVADAINLQSDATGVEAVINGTTLELVSSAFGSSAVVDIQIISEGTGGTFDAAIGQQARAEGIDIAARINGATANGNGNTLSINTATLDLNLSVSAAFTGAINFDIAGGGALFQLGPDVVGNQQARVGIGSVNTARLGGVDGKLFQLRSGGSADLTTDPNAAALILDQASDQVTSLRGRLGAFQRTTLDTNIASLKETVANLTEAESSIRDADFAAESAALTRAQILVQSGTAVLAIANQNPQNVLSLLR